MLVNDVLRRSRGVRQQAHQGHGCVLCHSAGHGSPSTADSAIDSWGAIILAAWASLLPCRTGVPSAECGSGGDNACSAWVGTGLAGG